MVEQNLFQDLDSGSIPTSALQLRIMEIGAMEACRYNAKWHSVFPLIDWSNVVRNPMYVCYSAGDGINVFAVAIWSSPIAANRLKDGFKMLELRRMAISEFAPKNTASRMLGVMRRLIIKKFPNCIKLISYQDKNHHQGTIYKASGWTPANKCKFVAWDGKRKRNKEQSSSSKIRWECEL
jgi:hypothetical protein